MDFEHHGKATLVTSLLQSWSIEIFQHCRNTALLPKITSDEACTTALDLFQLADIALGVRSQVQDEYSTNAKRSDEDGIGSLSQFTSTMT